MPKNWGSHHFPIFLFQKIHSFGSKRMDFRPLVPRKVHMFSWKFPYDSFSFSSVLVDTKALSGGVLNVVFEFSPRNLGEMVQFDAHRFFSNGLVQPPRFACFSCRNIMMEYFSSWWCQPIWKILVKLDHFPKVSGWTFKKNVQETTTQFSMWCFNHQLESFWLPKSPYCPDYCLPFRRVYVALLTTSKPPSEDFGP